MLSIIFCPILRAETPTNDTFKNIEKTDEGYLLTGEQIIKLANYIEELKAENKKLELKLEEAEKQLEKMSEPQPEDFLQRLGDGLTGAGLAALIITVANSL